MDEPLETRGETCEEVRRVRFLTGLGATSTGSGRFLSFSSGNGMEIFCPTLRRSGSLREVFFCHSRSTVVFWDFAIFVRLSPFLTVYSIVSGVFSFFSSICWTITGCGAGCGDEAVDKFSASMSSKMIGFKVSSGSQEQG